MTTNDRGSAVIDRTSLRLAATLLLVGQLLYTVITLFHADGKANDHPAVFAEYAGSGIWKAIHVGQFASAAILLAGLLALFFVLNLQAGPAQWAGRFGAAATVVALALYGVLQAVDGVGNKQVDAAWVGAPHAEKAARFASPEAMRWLEWGVRSYLAYLMGLSGLTYLAQGWVVGAQGFSATNETLIVVAEALSLAWMIWLALVAWRTTETQASRTAARLLG